MTHLFRGVWLLAPLLALGVSSPSSQAQSSPAADLPAPLFDGLGNLHHPVTTKSNLAQRYFDQGLTLLYAFNHKEAIRSFKACAQVDPDCAMGWWGVGYASGPHVNSPMSSEDHTRAWDALQRALAGRPKVSVREQGYIDALAQRYEAEHKEDRAALDKAFAHAMRKLVKEYPDDLDAQTLFAESLMNTMPWDYWLSDRKPKPETEEALKALRHVIARDPDHPGANHFYIHAVEAGPSPELGLPSADRLARFAPQAGHLVHMPSHIYIRVGQYHDATAANELAIKADQSYLAQCQSQGFYPGVYFPHNLHFLWFALTFEGRTAEALKTSEKIAAYSMNNLCGVVPLVEAPRFRHLPWLTWARFGKWDEVLGVPQPPATNDFLVDRIMWHFTRGLALAAKQKGNEAGEEYAAMVSLIDGPDLKKLDSPIFPATKTFAVPRHLLAGKVAGVNGDQKLMFDQLMAAVAAEDAIPYMEPPFWPFPTRPVLAAALLAAGELVKAENVFREDLEKLPRNGWGLLGLEQSLRAQGKTQAADLVQRQFAEAWKHADLKLDLAWF